MSKKHPRSQPRKKPSADGEDAFVAGVLDASTWAKQNQSQLTIGGIALLVLLLAGWYWINYTGNLENRALVELEQIQGTMNTGDPEAAKVALAQYLENFGSTPLAGEASLMLAQLYLDTDQPGQAIQALSDSGVGIREPLGPQVFALRGRAFEAQGQFGQAEEVYLDVAAQAEIPFQRSEALADAARMRTQQDDATGAIELYDEILGELEVSDVARGEYEMRKAELETALAG